MKTIEFGGEVFEAGANWVQGLKNDETELENPIWTMAQEKKLHGHFDNDPKMIVKGAQGEDITKASLDKME